MREYLSFKPKKDSDCVCTDTILTMACPVHKHTVVSTVREDSKAWEEQFEKEFPNQNTHDYEYVPGHYANPGEIISFIKKVEAAAEQRGYTRGVDGTIEKMISSSEKDRWIEGSKQAGRKEAIKTVSGMIKKRKPTHGPCCTCQDCGFYFEGGSECECSRNQVLEEVIKSLSTSNPKE